MRVSGFTFVSIILAAAGVSNAQEPGNYPWRFTDSNSQAVIAPGMQPTPAPVPPATRVSHPTTKLFNFQEKQDPAQAAKNFTDQVPEAPKNPLPNPGDQKPPLNTQSNATDPDYFNQQCPSSWCNLGEINRIFGSTPRGTHVGGFAQFGIHDSNIPFLNNRSDRINVHQLWNFIHRPAERTCNWSFGYRFDTVYGTDGQSIQSIGNGPIGAPSGYDNGWNFGAYGAALPQAYVEMANCNTVIRAGRFLSMFGTEQVPSVENFFYSRSYTSFFTEPYGHSGVVALHQTSPTTTLISGFTAGWNTGFDNVDHGFNYLGGVRYQPNNAVSLALTSSIGDTGYRGSGVLQSLVASIKLNEKLTYVFAGDHLNLQQNDEFGIVNYLFYKVNPCLSFGSRVEWWKSDQLFTSTRSTWDFTSGINFRPHANVVFRPEVRMDYGAASVDSGKLIPALDAIFVY